MTTIFIQQHLQQFYSRARRASRPRLNSFGFTKRKSRTFTQRFATKIHIHSVRVTIVPEHHSWRAHAQLDTAHGGPRVGNASHISVPSLVRRCDEHAWRAHSAGIVRTGSAEADNLRVNNTKQIIPLTTKCVCVGREEVVRLHPSKIVLS